MGRGLGMGLGLGIWMGMGLGMGLGMALGLDMGKPSMFKKSVGPTDIYFIYFRGICVKSKSRVSASTSCRIVLRSFGS